MTSLTTYSMYQLNGIEISVQLSVLKDSSRKGDVKRCFTSVIENNGKQYNVALLKHTKATVSEREFIILKYLNKALPGHPNFIKCYGKIDSDIVFEEGDCDLMDIVINKFVHPYTGYQYEFEDRLLFFIDMLSALVALEKIEWVHRDVKGENFVLVDGVLKMIDFDTACNVNNPSNLFTGGTPEYLPPEICDLRFRVTRSVSKEVLQKWDIWSLGVVAMILGNNRHTPYWFWDENFHKKNHAEIIDCYRGYTARMRTVIDDNLLVSFGKCMVQIDTVERPSAQDILAAYHLLTANQG